MILPFFPFKCKCYGKQYLGKTTGEFCLRWNNYKNKDRKNVQSEIYMQNHLLDSDVKVMVMVMVTLSQMFLANVSMTLIDTRDDKDPKKGEH